MALQIRRVKPNPAGKDRNRTGLTAAGPMSAEGGQEDNAAEVARLRLAATRQRVSSGYLDRCKPYWVIMSCGHIETRMMREATAGIPWTPDATLTANARCADCDPSKQGATR